MKGVKSREYKVLAAILQHQSLSIFARFALKKKRKSFTRFFQRHIGLCKVVVFLQPFKKQQRAAILVK